MHKFAALGILVKHQAICQDVSAFRSVTDIFKTDKCTDDNYWHNDGGDNY